MRREIGSEGTWRGREIGWMRDEGGERVDERQKGGRICQEDRNCSLSVSGWVNLTVALSIMNKSSMVKHRFHVKEHDTKQNKSTQCTKTVHI